MHCCPVFAKCRVPVARWRDAPPLPPVETRFVTGKYQDHNLPRGLGSVCLINAAVRGMGLV